MKTLSYFGSFCLVVAIACPPAEAGAKKVVYPSNAKAVASSKLNPQITAHGQSEKDAQATADKQRELISQQKSLRGMERQVKDLSRKGYGSDDAVRWPSDVRKPAVTGVNQTGPATARIDGGGPPIKAQLAELSAVFVLIGQIEAKGHETSPASTPVRPNTKAKTSKKK